MSRWLQRAAFRFGSNLAGQRLQLDDWRRSGRYPVEASDLRDMADQQAQIDASARQVDAERRAQADILRSYDSRTVPGGCGDSRCNDPRCQR